MAEREDASSGIPPGRRRGTDSGRDRARLTERLHRVGAIATLPWESTAAVSATASLPWATLAAPWNIALLDQAHAHLVDRRPEVALVLAAMAAETTIEEVLSSLTAVESASRDLVESKPSRFLGNGSVFAAYVRVGGDPGIEREPWWHDYVAAGYLRNRVVHHGLRISEAEATAGFNATRQLVEYCARRWPHTARPSV